MDVIELLRIDPRAESISILRQCGMTYRKIGERFGISLERVRQIEHKHQRRARIPYPRRSAFEFLVEESNSQSRAKWAVTQLVRSL